MSDSRFTLSESPDPAGSSSNCEDGSECCQNVSVDGTDSPKTDGAGEPCPTPLMWQEIRERFLQDGDFWELERGPHQLVGRTWGQGRPLYFLNNFAATSELFALTVWLLRDQFQCVVYDTFARTDSALTRKSIPAISEFTEDLIAVADAHGDDKLIVYGAAFGAAIALQTAISHPQRLERMVLQHGFAVRRLSFFERTLASVCIRSRGTLNSLPQRRRFQAVNHQPWFPPYDHSRFEFLVESTGHLSLRDLARRSWAVNSFDVVSRLGDIGTPTMLLRTEGEGKVAAESQEVLEARLKHSRTEWMHSAGQHPYLTHPHRVAKLIQAFCDSDSGQE